MTKVLLCWEDVQGGWLSEARQTRFGAAKEIKPGTSRGTLNFIKKRYPRADFSKIGDIDYSDRENQSGEIVSHGPRGGKLIRVIVKRREGFGYDVSSAFKNRYDRALGPKSETIIAENDEKIRDLEEKKSNSRRHKKSLTKLKNPNKPKKKHRMK